MPQQTLLAMMLVAAAGAAIAAQAPINSALGRTLDSSVAAAALSFAVGFSVLAAITLITGDGGALTRVSSIEFWMLAGGACGAFFVWSALWGVPILGVLTTTTLLILGQIVAAILIDHFGAFGLAPRDVAPWRILAGVFVAAGAVLSRF